MPQCYVGGSASEGAQLKKKQRHLTLHGVGHWSSAGAFRSTRPADAQRTVPGERIHAAWVGGSPVRFPSRRCPCSHPPARQNLTLFPSFFRVGRGCVKAPCTVRSWRTHTVHPCGPTCGFARGRLPRHPRRLGWRGQWRHPHHPWAPPGPRLPLRGLCHASFIRGVLGRVSLHRRSKGRVGRRKSRRTSRGAERRCALKVRRRHRAGQIPTASHRGASPDRQESAPSARRFTSAVALQGVCTPASQPHSPFSLWNLERRAPKILSIFWIDTLLGGTPLPPCRCRRPSPTHSSCGIRRTTKIPKN